MAVNGCLWPILLRSFFLGLVLENPEFTGLTLFYNFGHYFCSNNVWISNLDSKFVDLSSTL